MHPSETYNFAGEDYPSTGRCLLFRIRKEDPDSKEGIAIASEESWSGVVACSHEVSKGRVFLF